MKSIIIGVGLLFFVLAFTACQAGAVMPVVDRSGALATSAGSAASTVPSVTETDLPAEAEAPTLQASPVVAATSTPVAEATQPGANEGSNYPPGAASGAAADPAENSATSSSAASTSPAQATSDGSAASPAASGSAGAVTGAPPSAPLKAPKTCQDVAAFYGDVTIPDGTLFRAGETFTKTWRFRNNGDCTWTPDYSVVFYAGEIMNAPLSVPFPATVAPGEQVDVSIDMQAPGRGGEHTGNWEFADPSGNHFAAGVAGKDRFWISINVSFVDKQGTAVPAGPVAPAGLVASSGFTPGATSAIPASCPGKQDRGYVTQVIALINQARRQNGLPALQENNQVDAAAASHSGDMACNNFLNHTGSDGSTWYDRLRAQGYAYNDARENIYAGDPGFGGDPQGAFDWWMNSQVHRENILNPESTEIGVGYVANPQSQYGGYFTVVFTRP